MGKDYLHAVPGRMRVKNPILKVDPDKQKSVQRLLNKTKGIKRTTVKPLTGSVRIDYDPELITADDILILLEKHNYFNQSRALTFEQYLKRKASLAGGKISRFALSWALGRTFEGTPLSLVIAFI